jgi:hypothetical protein
LALAASFSLFVLDGLYLTLSPHPPLAKFLIKSAFP